MSAVVPSLALCHTLAIFGELKKLHTHILCVFVKLILSSGLDLVGGQYESEFSHRGPALSYLGISDSDRECRAVSEVDDRFTCPTSGEFSPPGKIKPLPIILRKRSCAGQLPK